jgi:hypothetical protein
LKLQIGGHVKEDDTVFGSIAVDIRSQLGKQAVQLFPLAVPEQELLPVLVFGVICSSLAGVIYYIALVAGFLFQIRGDRSRYEAISSLCILLGPTI